MRKLVAGLVAGFFCICWLTQLTAQEVVVQQWNIAKGLGTFAKNTNDQAKAIARVVNYQQPDILLFNELQSANVATNTAALIDWVTNNVPYMGSQPGVSFFVAVSSKSDGFNRNAAISRYPISNATTHDDGLRGVHSFTVQLLGTNALQVFQAHFKCCSATNTVPTDAERRQANAQFAADTISAWASTNSFSYIFAGDWNEDEENPQSPLTATYHPITTVREVGGLVEFKPTDLNGNSKTISTSTASPTRRFDYCLASTNRLAASWGLVFSSKVWAQHGQYTNASPANLVTDSATASDHYAVVVAYEFATGPANLTIDPIGGLASSGSQGGPFSPSSQTYTLSNTGGRTMNWTASNLQSWVSLSATSGSLLPGGSTTVTISINANANSLATGSYSDTVSFTNTTDGNGNTTRTVALTVNPLPPGVLSVSPATGLSSSGNNGGPFSPSSQTYTLSNTGGQSINWTTSKSQSWVTLSATSGTLAGGASTSVTVSINSGANSLAAGTYSDTVVFTNTTNGNGNTTRAVTLTVNLTAPSAPSSLTATAVSKSQINLAWTDTSNNEAGFKIERSTNGTSFTEIATVGANVKSFSNTGLAANTTYYYRVRAYNAAGNSAYSNTASAKTKRN